jgi:hypothetical protein
MNASYITKNEDSSYSWRVDVDRAAMHMYRSLEDKQQKTENHFLASTFLSDRWRRSIN